MLKTLSPTEPELIRLCRAKRWVAVTSRSQSHPEEAAPSASAGSRDGTTGLAIAVRSCAPIGAIQVLIRADANQLTVCHKFYGSVLHESLKHHSSYDVLRLLLQEVIQYEQLCHGHDDDYASVLGRQDELGRTVLHHVVVRAVQELQMDGDRSEMWFLLRTVVLSYPAAVQVMDADGNTPLILALLLPGHTNAVQNEADEAYLSRMVQLMVASWPSAVIIARKVQHQWKRELLRAEVPPTIGFGAPTPLSYAILYGRSEGTFKTLLEAHQKIGVNACLSLVSGNREVHLHLAASLRSPMSLLRALVECDPNALRVQDTFYLTPLDWVWIRHVLDWCATEPPFAEIVPSTRRYLSPHFAGWHERTSEEMHRDATSDLPLHDSVIEALLERMHLLLPAAARASTVETRCEPSEPWSLLHSSCMVSCPLAVVRLACKQEPEALRVRDLRAGRLPLHYAAARNGYRATVPVGVSREIRTMVEQPPAVFVATKFALAARVVDANYQLPLHIAVDTAKRENDHDALVVAELLRLYPGALERRDGKTKLHPFLQAAAGPGASVSLTFQLLRENPTLVA